MPFGMGTNIQSLRSSGIKPCLRIAVNREAKEEEMAGKACIRWSEIKEPLSDFPHLRSEKASTTHSTESALALRSSAKREGKEEQFRAHPEVC